MHSKKYPYGKEEFNMNKKNIYTNHFTNEKENTYTPTAFKEIRHAFGLKELSYKTKDEKKLEKQREKFCKSHTCQFCGETREWVPDTNIMVCKNPRCKGYQVKSKDGEIISSLPSYSELSNYGEAIAETILK